MKTMRMPYAGIVTFLGAPVLQQEADLNVADIAVLGVPLDMATTNKGGARYGPRAIREASLLYTYHPAGTFATHHPREPMPGLYDIEEQKTFLKGYMMVDCGDVPVLPAELETTFDRIHKAAALLFRSPAFPVFLGGDHSMTYPIVRAYPGADPLHIVHLDTHLDVLDELDGARFTHGSPFRHIMGLPYFDGITQIGCRGILNDEIYHREMQERGFTLLTTYDIKTLPLEDIVDRLPRNRTIYLSIDIDVFDPSVAPGTGTPEPGGLFYWDVRPILREILIHNRVIGFDIVEVSPPYDHAGVTAHLAARLALDILGYILGNKGEPPTAIRDLKRASLETGAHGS